MGHIGSVLLIFTAALLILSSYVSFLFLNERALRILNELFFVNRGFLQSDSFRRIAGFLRAKLVSDPGKEKSVYFYLNGLYHAAVISLVASLSVMLYRLYILDLSSYSIVRVVSEDMSLYQRLFMIFRDPAFALLYQTTAAGLVLYIGGAFRISPEGRNLFRVYISGILILIPSVIMVFFSDYLPFRSFENKLRSGAGLSESFFTNLEGIGLWIFYTSAAFFTSGFSGHFTKEEDDSGNYFHRVMSVSALLSGISFFIRIYLYFRSGSDASPDLFIIFSMILFISGSAFLFNERYTDYKSGFAVIGFSVSGAALLISPEKISSFLQSFVIFIPFAYTLAVYLRKKVRPFSQDFSIRAVSYLMPVFLILGFAGVQLSYFSGTCSGVELCLSRYALLTVMLMHLLTGVLFVSAALLFFSSLRKLFFEMKRNIFSANFVLIFAAGLAAGSAIQYFMIQSTSMKWDILLSGFYSILSVSFLFVFVYLYISFSRSISISGVMQSYFSMLYLPVKKRPSLFGNGLLGMGIMFAAAGLSGFNAKTTDSQTFHYFLQDTGQEYSDYVHYYGGDKVFSSIFEITAEDFFIVPHFNDGADPQNIMHMTVSREAFFSVYSPGTPRKKEKPNHNPSHISQEDSEPLLASLMSLHPDSGDPAVERYRPVVNPSTGEVNRQDTSGTTLRKRRTFGGIFPSVFSTVRISMKQIVKDDEKKINHLFEYFFYYTNRSREFYAGVFPAGIQAVMQINVFPNLIFLAVSPVILALAVLIMLFSRREDNDVL